MMKNNALEIETKDIENFAAYDAKIEVFWRIGFGDNAEIKQIGFVGFYCAWNENENKFRLRVLKAYDAIKLTYENFPDDEIRMALTFFDTDVNM